MRSKIVISIILVTILSIKLFGQYSTLQLNFGHYIGDQKLVLDSVMFKNELGQNFTVSKFKYYVSNFHFKSSSGKDIFINETFLINEDEEESKKIILNKLPAGNYTSFDFILGVDSLHNCSGAQSGALDPVNAMFWAWNTGYIFLKLEGFAPNSLSPGKFFEYHIGGYKQPSNCIRKISIALGKEVKTDAAITKEIKLKVNILEILKTPTTIDFSKLSSVTDHKNATLVADNYSDMFKLMPNEK
ncbi:MAG: hypothetical protein H0U95_17920 [Bacteroidetes bacterium]|nr:hypothetical protein [Bacteroidota bacterium]